MQGMNSDDLITSIPDLAAAWAATRPSTGAARRSVLRQARDPRARALREAYHRWLADQANAPKRKTPEPCPARGS